jgi:hypothetical protein
VGSRFASWAAVLVNGFDGRLTLADAVNRARKQEKRIERGTG